MSRLSSPLAWAAAPASDVTPGEISERRRASATAVADSDRHSHHLGLVGDIRPEPREHAHTLWLADRTQPPVGLARIALGRCMQTQQPGGVTANARGALVQHRLCNLARQANLPAVTGVERQSPQRDHASGVHDVGDRGSMGVEPTGQHRGGVVEATHLQQEVPSHHLGDVQKEAKPTLERLGD